MGLAAGCDGHHNFRVAPAESGDRQRKSCNCSRTGFVASALVSRFRSSHHYAACSLANFGIKGTLAIYDSSAGFGFEVPTQTRGYNDRNFKSTALDTEHTRHRTHAIVHDHDLRPGKLIARRGAAVAFGFSRAILALLIAGGPAWLTHLPPKTRSNLRPIFRAAG